MPLCLFSLLKLSGDNPSEAVDSILRLLVISPQQSNLLTACKPRFPVIHSQTNDTHVTQKPWDILLVFAASDKNTLPALPSFLEERILDRFCIIAGVPSRLTDTYAQRNQKLINAPKPNLTVDLHKASQTSSFSSSQSLALSPDLVKNASDLSNDWKGPVSQLNLLKFEPNMTESYHKYGQEFNKVAGEKRGADAKIVGIIPDSVPNQSSKVWDEISLVHYPTIWHFVDMSAGDDYREINEKWRLPALNDTALICTTEIDLTKYLTAKN